MICGLRPDNGWIRSQFFSDRFQRHRSAHFVYHLCPSIELNRWLRWCCYDNDDDYVEYGDDDEDDDNGYQMNLSKGPFPKAANISHSWQLAFRKDLILACPLNSKYKYWTYLTVDNWHSGKIWYWHVLIIFQTYLTVNNWHSGRIKYWQVL